MTHSYTVAGITCNGCVAKVKNKLLMHPDVLAAEVTLEDQKAIITMQKHLTLNELQETIGADTKYRISADTSNHSHHVTKSGDEKSWIATYKPLLIIFAFIMGVAFLSSFHSGQLHGMMFMNYFMAGFFLVFSFFKMLDIKGFASSYSMYDLLAKKSPAYGHVYPFIELTLGVAYLVNLDPLITNMTTVVVMGFSSLGVIQSVIKKQKIQCACLGAVFNLPMSTVTIIEDLLMVAMATSMLLFSNSNG